MAEEKDGKKPEGQGQDQAGGPPVPENPGEEQGTRRPGHIIDISGAKIDKIAAERKAAGQGPPAAKKAKKEAAKAAPAGTGKRGQDEPEVKADEDKDEWELTSAELEARKKAERQAGRPKKKEPAKKEAPAEDEAELEAKKQKLEEEIREKYGIPKSDKPTAPFVIPETEQVVRIPHEQLVPFKDHPFHVEKNAKFLAFVASIRAQGVTQPAIVRPNDEGKYEIVSGHRRDAGSMEAGIPYTPCIVRPLTDDQAVQQMVEDNVNNREVTTMELAYALKMQLDSIKHQGARDALDGQDLTADIDKRSNAIIAERNGMSVKQVQRYINLTRLVKPLQDMVEGKKVVDGKPMKISFTPAVELSAIRPKMQEYIAVAIEAQQAAPSLSQAQRMRKLDADGHLNNDTIDGIMLEEKKEVDDKVIINGAELEKYFGKEKTPQEMKEQIIKLLTDWSGQQKDTPKKEAPEK